MFTSLGQAGPVLGCRTSGCGDGHLVGNKNKPLVGRKGAQRCRCHPKPPQPSGGEELIVAVEPGLSLPGGYNPNPHPSCGSTGVVRSGVGCCGPCQRGAAVGWAGSSQNPFVGLLEVSALLLCLPPQSTVVPVASGVCPAWHQGSQCSPPRLPSCSADGGSSLKINCSIFNCGLNNCFIFI